jgi:hypothetical protein
LHTGECEVRGDDIGGIAVHIGARVSALAGANEVLVSSTLRDLVIGSGLEFDDRGTHALKGVPGECACSRSPVIACNPVLERCRLVAVGDVRVVESSFGGDGCGGGVGAGVSAFGHHHRAVVRWTRRRVGRRPQRGGRLTQCRNRCLLPG